MTDAYSPAGILQKVETIGIRITDVELLTEEKIREEFSQGESSE
jgi:hypothetical protein